MKTFVLGAGVSRGFVRGNTFPPTMTEFFNVAGLMNWLAETDMCHGLWECLIEDQGLKKLDEVWKLKLSIEDLMCELFDEAMSTGNWELYMQLEFFIKSVLARTTNGPAWPPMDQFVAALEPGSGLITFNYDCLLEKSLIKSDWRPETGYRTMFHGRFIDRGGKDVFSQRVGGGMGSWDYLKLHGSLNWLVDRDVHANWVFKTGRLTSKMSLNTYLLDTIRIEGRGQPFTNMSGMLEDDDGSDLFSLIIPPARKKEYGEYRAILGYLWDIAKKKICESQELAFVGFSFPRTDENLKVLFDSYSGGTVTVVNRTIDDDLRKRYEAVFPKAKINFIQQTFQEYCAGLAPFDPPVKPVAIPKPSCDENIPEDLAASVAVATDNANSEVIVESGISNFRLEVSFQFRHSPYIKGRFDQYDSINIPTMKKVALAEHAAAIARSLPCTTVGPKTKTRQDLGASFGHQFDVTIEVRWWGDQELTMNLVDFIPAAMKAVRKDLDSRLDEAERKRIAGASNPLGIKPII